VTTSDLAPRAPSQAAAYARHPSGTYAVVVALFCGLLLISNVAATKPIAVIESGVPLLGGIFTDGGALLFPLTYVLGDVLAEVYGLRQARRAIVLGFILSAVASIMFLLVGAAPPAPGYENNEAFRAVLGFVPQIVLASLCGFLAGQFLNAYVLVKIKERFGERRLWVRLFSSTVVGELVDTVLFSVIAFATIFTTEQLVSFIVVGWLWKVGVEALLLPVTYAVIKAVKRREPDYAVHAATAARVRQLRLVVAVPDYDEAVRFYRDQLGLVQEEQYDSPGGARVMILGAGRATLELSNPAQIDYIDSVEVGRPGVAPQFRVALEVDDAAVVTDRLMQAGAGLIAPPTRTPWNSLNARLDGPAGVQLTVFTELGDADNS
jgi:uncharacterized integral membrane protein (TIGR00697 family)